MADDEEDDEEVEAVVAAIDARLALVLIGLVASVGS